MRSFRESKVQSDVEDSWLFRGQQVGHNPLRVNMTADTGALFGSNPRYNAKALLVDFAIVNPCVNIDLENAVYKDGKHLTNPASRRKPSIGIRSPQPTLSSPRLFRCVAELVHTCILPSRSSALDGEAGGRFLLRTQGVWRRGQVKRILGGDILLSYSRH